MCDRFRTSSRTSRWLRLTAAVPVLVSALALTGLAGCRSYVASPVDAAAHREAFLGRADRVLSRLDEPRSPDAAGPVDLERLEEAALVFNADLRVARLEAGVAAAASEFGGLWDDPSVGIQWTELLETAVDPSEFLGLASLTVPVSGRLELEKARLGAEHAVALESVARLEWQIRMDLARAWTEWRAASMQVAENRRFLDAVDAVLGVVDLLEESGELPRTETRLLRIERSVALATLARLVADQARLALEVVGIAGLPPSAVEWLADPAVGPWIGRAGPIGHLSDLPCEASPAVRVAKASYEAAERRLEEEVRRQYPDLELGGAYGEQDGEEQFQLGVSIRLPIWNRNQRAIAEADAAREAARVVLERAVERRESEIAAATRVAEGAAAVRSVVEGELVPLAEDQYAEARELARLGEVNVLGWVVGLGHLLDARVRRIEASRDEAIAWIRVREASGEWPVEAAPTIAPDEGGSK